MTVVFSIPTPPSTKATPADQQIVDTYKELGSVWKVGERLGISGQAASVRLKAAGHPVNRRDMSDAEREIIRQYYLNTPIDDFDLAILAASIGRTRTFVCRWAGCLGLTDKTRAPPSHVVAKSKTGRRLWLASNEHPRGMLGKKHTAETLAKIGDESKKNWGIWKAFDLGPMTPENRELSSERMKRIAALRSPESSFSRARGGRRDDLGQTWFRSSWEANYARYLNLMIRLGVVTSWEFEPETFWFEGIRRGTASYLPDFKVFYKGDPVPEYVEIKGWVTPKDLTKWKRMAKYHPHIKLVKVKVKEYTALARKWSSSIPNWEGSIGGGYKTGPRAKKAA